MCGPRSNTPWSSSHYAVTRHERDRAAGRSYSRSRSAIQEPRVGWIPIEIATSGSWERDAIILGRHESSEAAAGRDVELLMVSIGAAWKDSWAAAIGIRGLLG